MFFLSGFLRIQELEGIAPKERDKGTQNTFASFSQLAQLSSYPSCPPLTSDRQSQPYPLRMTAIAVRAAACVRFTINTAEQQSTWEEQSKQKLQNQTKSHTTCKVKESNSRAVGKNRVVGVHNKRWSC